jgi:hypothetical protein
MYLLLMGIDFPLHPSPSPRSIEAPQIRLEKGVVEKFKKSRFCCILHSFLDLRLTSSIIF